MLQYKIPQDVQREDKIVGPLTLKQLIIVAIGGGISYSLFLFTSKYYFLGIFDYFWISIPALISLAFAFLKINDVGFLKWLFLLYEFGKNSRFRKWDKGETSRLHFAFVTAKIGTDSKKKKAADLQKTAKKSVDPGKKKFSSLEELTNVLDHKNPFPDHEKSLDTDHHDDHGLNLTADEKYRHEERLKNTIISTSSPQNNSRPDIPQKPSPDKFPQKGSISFS